MAERKSADAHILNEPVATLAGGPRRASVAITEGLPAALLIRGRVLEVLQLHDPEDDGASIETALWPIVRQIAREGAITNNPPMLRYRAIQALGSQPTQENLNLLTELAMLGEDFYVRGHALLGLGRTGLLLAGVVLKRALAAEEPFERSAAETALFRLGRVLGSPGLRLVFERDDQLIPTIERLIEEVEAGSKRHGPQGKPKRTSAGRGSVSSA
jgi:HEAT repeat protein